MADNYTVQRQGSYYSQDLLLKERRYSNLTELLAELLAVFGEAVVAEPDNLEEALQALLVGVQASLGLGRIELSAKIGESRRISLASSWPDVADDTDRFGAEFPILRGKTIIGVLRADPASFGLIGDAARAGELPDMEPLERRSREGLRTVAAAVALALDAAHARELANQRAAQRSVVQVASEALGTILDENQLYKSVLVLTLELLEASAGAILLADGTVVSLGLEGNEEMLAALKRVRFEARRPFIGRICEKHTLGVGFDREGGAVFLVRKTGPYSETEGVSLTLVAHQLSRARERSRLYASLESTTLEAISALAMALESRDDTTGEHIKRTQTLTAEVAKKLGLGPEEVRVAQYAAVLHDVGKIGIPDSILNKPAKLSEEEWTIMRRHPKIGADIVKKISGFVQVAEAVLTHHERYDGRGYPSGLAGREIPVGARLISVVDAYDAMTSDRPYRKALSREWAIAELEAGAGSQFDPEVVEALRAVLCEQNQGEEAYP